MEPLRLCWYPWCSCAQLARRACACSALSLSTGKRLLQGSLEQKQFLESRNSSVLALLQVQSSTKRPCRYLEWFLEILDKGDVSQCWWKPCQESSSAGKESWR